MKTYYKNIIKFLSGVLLINIIFWNRVLRIRLPQEFSKLNPEYINFYIISSGLCALVFAFLFCHTLKKLIALNYTGKLSLFLNNKYYLKIQEIIKNYIIDAPQYVYETLTKNINLAKLIEYPASMFSAHFPYPRTFVIIFYFTPQILVSFIFFIETCFFQQRIFFIKILSLLILLLLAKVIIFLFKTYSDRRLKHYALFFDIIKKEDGINHISLKPPHMLPQHIPLEKIVNNYNTMYLYWIIYNHINGMMLEIEEYNKKYGPYIQLITYFFFTLGWLSVMLFLLFLKT